MSFIINSLQNSGKQDNPNEACECMSERTFNSVKLWHGLIFVDQILLRWGLILPPKLRGGFFPHMVGWVHQKRVDPITGRWRAQISTMPQPSAARMHGSRFSCDTGSNWMTYCISPVNDGNTSQSWLSVKKGNSVFLWACSVALWCSMSCLHMSRMKHRRRLAFTQPDC